VGICGLAEALKVNTGLRHLLFNDDEYDDCDDFSAKEVLSFAEALKTNTTLHTLRFSGASNEIEKQLEINRLLNTLQDLWGTVSILFVGLYNTNSIISFCPREIVKYIIQTMIDRKIYEVKNL